MPDVMYRYGVVETWGDLPERLTEMVGSAERFMLYREDRGESFQQELHRRGKGIVGGYVVERRGTVLVENNRVVAEYDDA